MRWFYRLCFHCSFWSLLLVALILSAARLLAPQANQLQPQLVDYLQQQLHTSVSVTQVRAGWQGARPYFLLDGLTLGPPADQLYLGKVRIYLRPADLLRAGLNALQLEIIGARVELRQQADGGWTVSGLSAASIAEESGDQNRNQTLQALLQRGDLSLVDSELRIVSATGTQEPVRLQIDHADLTSLTAASWRAPLEQLAHRPEQLPRKPEPAFVSAQDQHSRFGLQMQLRPMFNAAASLGMQQSEQQDSTRDPGLQLVIQLRFTHTGLAVEGYLQAEQQSLSDWLALLPAEQLSEDWAAQLANLELGSRLWFGWREHDYLQLRGQLDWLLDAAADHSQVEQVAGVATTAIRVPDNKSAATGISSDVALLWQQMPADEPDYWRLLLDNVAVPGDLPQASWLLLGSNVLGGWSASADNLLLPHLDGMLGLLDSARPSPSTAQLRAALADWVSIDQPRTRLDVTELVLDQQQRIVAADISLQHLLLQQAVLAGPATDEVALQSALAQTGITDCGPFDLQLTMQQQLGRFDLRADNAVCQMPSLWREPMLFEQIQLHGQLEQLVDGFRAHINDGQLRTPDFTLHLAAQLQHTALGLQAGVQAAIPSFLAERLPSYLPPDYDKPGTVRWLGQALQGGWIRDLRMGWEYDQNSTAPPWQSLQLQLQLDDVVMNYARNWPAAQQLNSEVRIIDGRLLAPAASGRMAGSRVNSVAVQIEDLFTGAALHLQAEVGDEAEQLLDLLAAMPITANGFTNRDYSLRGAVNAHAEIGIDLGDQTTLLYARGQARMQGVQAITRQITINDIYGDLKFDDNGPDNSQLSASWGAYPAQLNWVRTAAGPEIRMQGQFSSQQVAHAALDLPSLIEQYIAGESLWKLRLLIGREQTLVRAYSDLLGTELRLPPPLSKLAAVRNPLSLQLPVGGPGARLTRLNYGPLVQEGAAMTASTGLLALALQQDDEQQVKALSMHFQALDTASSDSTLPYATALTAADDLFIRDGWVLVSGRAQSFDPLGWGQLMLAYQRDQVSVATASEAQKPGLELNIDTNIGVGRLLLQQRNLGPVQLHIDNRQTRIANSQDVSAMVLSVSGPNLAGTTSILTQAAGLLVNVDMQRIYLPPPGLSLSDATGSDAAGPPKLLPRPGEDVQRRNSGITMNLIADDVRYEQLDLGTVRLELVPMLNGVSLQLLEARSDMITLMATGGWQETSGATRSQLEMRLDSNDMGMVLRGLGYDELIRDAQTTMLLDVSWPGDIKNFDLAGLQGSLHVQTGRGVIPKASPGVGRALGLLSLQALPQRLFLDFSDVFAEGMEFDSASGRFVFADGIVTAEDVQIKAPAANITITGTTDLVAKTYDQRLLIEPSSSLALPIIGAIAGGPIGAGAGFALQGLFGGSISSISKVQYQVTGPWQDPQLVVYSPEPTVKIKD